MTNEATQSEQKTQADKQARRVGESNSTDLLSLGYSKAYEEEKLTALWVICAVLCFGFGFDFAAWGFTLKAVFDCGCAMRFAWLELKQERDIG